MAESAWLETPQSGLHLWVVHLAFCLRWELRHPGIKINSVPEASRITCQAAKIPIAEQNSLGVILHAQNESHTGCVILKQTPTFQLW